MPDAPTRPRRRDSVDELLGGIARAEEAVRVRVKKALAKTSSEDIERAVGWFRVWEEGSKMRNQSMTPMSGRKRPMKGMASERRMSSKGMPAKHATMTTEKMEMPEKMEMSEKMKTP